MLSKILMKIKSITTYVVTEPVQNYKYFIFYFKEVDDGILDRLEVQ